MKFKKTNSIDPEYTGVIIVDSEKQGDKYHVRLHINYKTRWKYLRGRAYSVVFKDNNLYVYQKYMTDERITIGDNSYFNELDYLLTTYLTQNEYHEDIIGTYSIDLKDLYAGKNSDKCLDSGIVVTKRDLQKVRCGRNKTCLKIRCRPCDIDAIYHKDIDRIGVFTSINKDCMLDIIDLMDIIEYRQIPNTHFQGLYTYDVIAACDISTEYKTYFLKKLYVMLSNEHKSDRICIEGNSTTSDTVNNYDKNADITTPSVVIEKSIGNNDSNCICKTVYDNHFDIFTICNVVNKVASAKQIMDSVAAVRHVQYNTITQHCIKCNETKTNDNSCSVSPNDVPHNVLHKRNIINLIRFGKSRCEKKR